MNETRNGLVAGEVTAAPAPQNYGGQMLDPMPPKPRMRSIQIDALDHGYVVQVGCQRFAIEDKSTLIGKLSEYINNPVETETKYNEGKLF